MSHTFHFVVKHFGLITASWNMFCCTFVGNRSNLTKQWLCAKYFTKTFNQNTVLVSEGIFKIICLCESLRKPKTYCMQEKEITENSLTTLLVCLSLCYYVQNAWKGYSCRERTWYGITDAIKHVLHQRFKHSTIWPEKVTNTNKCIYCKCCKARKLLLKNNLAKGFFLSWNNQMSPNPSQMFWSTLLMVKVRLTGKRPSNVISVNDFYFIKQNSKRKNFENILLKLTVYVREAVQKRYYIKLTTPPNYSFMREN